MSVILLDDLSDDPSTADGLDLVIDSTNFEYLCFYRAGGLDLSLKNWISGKPDLAIGGTPPDAPTNDGILLKSGVSWLNTAMPDGKEVTIISVVKAVDDNTHQAVSNYLSTSTVIGPLQTIGMSLNLGVGTASDNLVVPSFGKAKVVNGVSASGNVVGASVSVGTYQCLVGRYSDTDKIRRFNNLTTNNTVAATADTTNPVDLGGALRIGSGYSTTYNGSGRHLLDIGVSRSLTDSEMNVLYTKFIKPICAYLGYVV